MAKEIPHTKKKYDLGLDIFELKRELGMGGNPTSSRGDVSHWNNVAGKILNKNKRHNSSFDFSTHRND